MTEPLELPANALGDARTLLHGALAATFTRLGWTAEGRVQLYPQLTPVTPGAWVDAATLSVQGAGLTATFPLIVTVDGTDREQVRRLDAVTAVCWELLEAITLPNGSVLQMLTAGPDQIDLGGPSVRAVTFAVQVPIGPRTLCPTALTESGEPTP